MMIKINLLPLESFKQTASGQLSVTIFGVVIVALIICLYLFKGMVMDPAVQVLEKTKADQVAQLNQLKADGAAARIKTAKFVEQVIKIIAISNLEERRRDQARLFYSIASSVSNQTSWLISLNHTNRNVLSIRGMATDQEVVADFLNSLEHNSLLKDVVLIRAARDTTINGIRLVTFDIQAKTSFPPASLLENGIPDVNIPAQKDLNELVKAAAPDLATNLTEAQTPATL
ncbi:MAG: PilN domain-containing protein [Deltaproteobacteria bacterium]|jgi:Tfp pilus assembly protein PilN|nr:PilN domain-containing protein [Deltaproteobacteria bacterium]